jgi:RNA polymerase sigma factor (sigma-70 family)
MADADELAVEHDAIARTWAAWAKRHLRRDLDEDDLLQTARVALLIAARRYRPERRASFLTYATWVVRGHLLHLARDDHLVRPPRGVRGADRRMTVPFPDRDEPRDPPAPQDVEAEALGRVRVEDALRALPRSERRVAVACWLLDRPIDEVAAALHLSSRHVGRLLASARAHLRPLLS